MPNSASPTGRADRPHTYADLCQWVGDTRWELIDGEAHAMAGPTWQHQAVLAALTAQLLTHFRIHACRVLPAPFDVRLARGDEADGAIETVVQPDISVVCDSSKLDARGCRGAPDLVIEILSPWTAAYDHLTKRAIYERHGVREYWLVHPTDRMVIMYRRRSEHAFEPPELLEARGSLEMVSFAGLTIDWDHVFADVPPE
jgi:Uma2 family endonuclease